MKRIARIFRMIPLAFFCAMLVFAGLNVKRDRDADAAKTSLPTRIGQTQTEQSFMQATVEEMRELWMLAYLTVMPGMIPTPVAQAHTPQSSLDALKTRTRNQARGLDANGMPTY